jgi:hypothetical protein
MSGVNVFRDKLALSTAALFDDLLDDLLWHLLEV